MARARTSLITAVGVALVASISMVPAGAQAAAEPPPNDSFSRAAALPTGGGQFVGSNVAATAEVGEPAHARQWGSYDAAYHSVWWSWTPAASGVTEISTCGSDFNTRMGVYTGSAVDALDEVTSNADGNRQECSDSRWAVASFYAEADTTYYIAVDTEAGIDGDTTTPPQGMVTLELKAPGGGYEPPPPGERPANDDFASPAVIPAEGGGFSGDNANATEEPGEPNHGRSVHNHAFHSLWWSWTAASSGETTIATCGSAFDTRIGVYTGSALGQLTEVAWNEDGNIPGCSSPKAAGVTFQSVKDTTYRIAVDTSGALSDGGEPRGAVQLTLVAPPGGEPVDDDENAGTAVTETPFEFTMLRLKPLCSEEGSKSMNDCPRKATNLRFYSAEKHQTWDKRQDSVRRWVDKLRSRGADITLVMVPKPSHAMDGAVMKYLRKQGRGGEILTQNVEPRKKITTTANDPLFLKVSYFDPAEDQKILDATLAALEKKGEDRKEVRSPCQFIDTNASPNAIELKLAETLGAGTLTQKRAGQILKEFGCGYEVAEYVDGAGFTTDVVLDVVGVDRKRHIVQLKVALPVAQDFLFVVSEEPEFAETEILGLGVDGKLTASKTQQNRITVQVLERLTGRLVPGVALEFYGTNGKPRTERTNEKGEWTFTSKMANAGEYMLKATYASGGAKMVGFRQVDVVDRRADYVTMSGRTMTWNGSSYVGTDPDIDRAKSLDVVPGNLGTGLIGAPSAAPVIKQITAAVPTADGFVLGQHNGISIPDNTNFAVGTSSGLVVIGGGLPSQVGANRPTAALAWPNPFAAVAQMLSTIVTGLQRTFQQGPDGEGTVAKKTTAADQAKITAAAETLAANGTPPPASGLISDKGLGVIATGGGNVIATGGGNVIATGGLNGPSGVIATGGGNVISTGGGNLIQLGSGNVIATGGGNVMPVYGGNVIATGGGN